MLRLKKDTDPRWAHLAGQDLEEILSDHAFCEQKAASTCISLIVKYPEYPELVTEMSAIVREEMEHFQRVHELILKRGLKLGRERKDPYVNELALFISKEGDQNKLLVDRLLFSAMIEARSCERFKVLSDNIDDDELANFYRELMVSEAGHYSLFLKFARKYSNPKNVDVDARWQEWLNYEAEVISRYGKTGQMHG